MSDRKLFLDEKAGPGARLQPQEARFDRRELDQILHLYGLMVAAGEWRDYALSFGPKLAVFAVYRRASERPLYRIEKRPELRNLQGAYAVLNGEGAVLKRGRDLAQVLRLFEKRRLSLID